MRPLHLLAAGGLAFSLACAGGNSDKDEDGLTLAEEEELGRRRSGRGAGEEEPRTRS